MAVSAATEPRLESAWRSNQRQIRVYHYGGGPRVAALLRLAQDDAVLMLNTAMLSTEGRRVAMGWALSVAGYGATDGFYAIFTETPPVHLAV